MGAYCTPEDVASLLRLIDPSKQRYQFSETTDPTREEVERIIDISSFNLEHMSGTAWRPVRRFEYKDYEYSYLGTRLPESPVCLLRTPLCKMSHDEGDKLEIWKQGGWIDLLVDGEEGRNADYWIDYNSGIIYLVRARPDIMTHSICVTYRYGHDEVPADIRDACAKLTACWYLESDFFLINLPVDGSSLVDPHKTAEIWRADVERIVSGHRTIGLCNV